MVCGAAYMNHLSSEILCAFQLGFNVRAPYVEYNISTCAMEKITQTWKKLKEKDNFLFLGEKKILAHAASVLKLCFWYLLLSSCYEKLNGKTDPLFLKLGNEKVTVQCFYGFITNEK